MTVRTNAVQVCDRCQKPFHEKNLKAGDEVPLIKQFGLVVSQVTGTNKDENRNTKVLVTFEDICPTCHQALDSLIKRIRLDSGDGKPVKAPASQPSAPGVAKKKRGRRTKAQIEADAAAQAQEATKAPSKGNGTSQVENSVVEAAEAPIEDTDVPAGFVKDENGDVYNPNTGEVVGRVKPEKEIPF